LSDTSQQSAEEIIVRLNGIKEPDYSSKISYEIFKTLGRTYERKYQKDMQESLEVLNPILKIMDSVFLELSKNQEKMKKICSK